MSDLGLIEQTGGSPSAALGLAPAAGPPVPSSSAPRSDFERINQTRAASNLPPLTQAGYDRYAGAPPQVADNTNAPPPTGIAAGRQAGPRVDHANRASSYA